MRGARKVAGSFIYYIYESSAQICRVLSAPRSFCPPIRDETETTAARFRCCALSRKARIRAAEGGTEARKMPLNWTVFVFALALSEILRLRIICLVYVKLEFFDGGKYSKSTTAQLTSYAKAKSLAATYFKSAIFIESVNVRFYTLHRKLSLYSLTPRAIRRKIFKSI